MNELEIDYEIWDIKLSSASISPTPSIVTIENGYCTLSLKDLTLNVTADYSYVTNPPILADIGEASFLISDFTTSTDFYFYLHSNYGQQGSKLELNLKNTHVQSGVEPFAKFDGISDFSDVASNTVNTLAAVLRNRVNSFINGGD